MFGIGPQELLLILVIALIVVGPRRLPEMARSIGKGLREVRKAQDEVRKTIQVNLDEPAPRPPSARTPPATEDAEAPGEAPAVSGTDLAATGAAAGSVADVSRTLGRGLAELRKAREEIQRTFRVDLDEAAGGGPAGRPGKATRSSQRTDTDPTGDAAEPTEGDESGDEPNPGSRPAPPD